MLILIHLSLLGLLSWRLFRFYHQSPLRLYFWPALALKIVAGLALGLLYFFYYGHGDTLGYHHDATELANLARDHLWAYLEALVGEYPADLELAYHQQERALLTAKVFSLFYIVTLNQYWITACYVSFGAFAALFRLAHRLALYRPELSKAAALAFLFWPSFVFWTSGLLKESLAIICIAFSVGSALPFILAAKKLDWMEGVLSVLLLIFLFQIKYYYAGLLVPVLFCLLLSIWVGRQFSLKKIWKWTVFLLSLVVGVGVATQLHPNLYPSRFLEVWVQNYFLISEVSSEGGFVVYEGMEADWSYILEVSPKAIFTGLYEPLFLFDATNIFRMAASAENWLLLLLTFTGLAGWILKERARISLPVFATLLYIIAFALVMSIAAPNYGALLRYRICYQPFFVFLILAGTFQLIRWLRKKEKETSKE